MGIKKPQVVNLRLELLEIRLRQPTAQVVQAVIKPAEPPTIKLKAV
jgi:hypothetical protein